MIYNVLFVCLGNTCRSVMAEAVLKDLLRIENLTDKVYVDSCATANYHVGEDPNPYALEILRRHGLDSNHRARVIEMKDFSDFDMILGMDSNNIYKITSVGKHAQWKGINMKSTIKRLGSYDPHEVLDVYDPYCGEIEDFEECYQHVSRCCKQFLKSVASEL